MPATSLLYVLPSKLLDKNSTSLHSHNFSFLILPPFKFSYITVSSFSGDGVCIATETLGYVFFHQWLSVWFQGRSFWQHDVFVSDKHSNTCSSWPTCFDTFKLLFVICIQIFRKETTCHCCLALLTQLLLSWCEDQQMWVQWTRLYWESFLSNGVWQDGVLSSFLFTFSWLLLIERDLVLAVLVVLLCRCRSLVMQMVLHCLHASSASALDSVSVKFWQCPMALSRQSWFGLVSVSPPVAQRLSYNSKGFSVDQLKRNNFYRRLDQML